MKQKPPSPPRRRLNLSTEDEALWEHTAASLEPLRRKKSRHHSSVTDPDAMPPFEAAGKAARKVPDPDAAASHGKKLGPPAQLPAVKAEPPSAKSTAPAPALNSFDRKAARRLRQGQIEIEARIDLHGMRQHEAHAALRRFLLSSSARGLRWVLVITGKGGPRRRNDDDDAGFGASERGVLRRNVPMWLAEPELRAVVVSYTAAAIPHGGDGALYVQLRNPDRKRS